MVVGYRISKQKVSKPWKYLRLKNFMIIFKFLVQFFFFSELGMIVFFENGLGSLQAFLILQICDKPEVLQRFLCCLFSKPLNKGIFIVLEDSLRIISGA
jgi:hypothetical protein